MSGSGPLVARLFRGIIAAAFAAAFVSILAQLEALMGPDGVFPVASNLDLLMDGLPLAPPSLFWLDGSLTTLTAGAITGIVASLLALLDRRRFRGWMALVLVLFYSFSVAEPHTLTWPPDFILLWGGLLAVFLDPARPAPAVHLAFRILLFKLYFEPGLHKLLSPGDNAWHDGSAVALYFEVLPAPGPLARLFATMPGWLSVFLSWATLVIEILGAIAIFGGRRLRLAAAAGFTVLQVGILLSSNYGLLPFLMLALNVFLLEDSDIAAVRRRFGFQRADVSDKGESSARARLAVTAIAVVWGVHTVGSMIWPPEVSPTSDVFHTWRVSARLNMYGQMRRDRYELDYQVRPIARAPWRSVWMHGKPGDVTLDTSGPGPHHRRLVFASWFAAQLRMPKPIKPGSPIMNPPEPHIKREYQPLVRRMLDRLCRAPEAMQELFSSELPPFPDATRVVVWRYAWDRTGDAVWTREQVVAGPELSCLKLEARPLPATR